MGKKAKSKAPRRNVIDEAKSNAPRWDVVADYLKRLEEAARNRDNFKAVFGDLSADTKGAGKTEMVNIARGYVKGYGATSSPRKTALEKIEREFIRRVRYENERKSAKG